MKNGRKSIFFGQMVMLNFRQVRICNVVDVKNPDRVFPEGCLWQKTLSGLQKFISRFNSTMIAFRPIIPLYGQPANKK
ncbi:MAG: hypothetical protein B6I19_07010 [Bacteroidetes bacterium 4572_114]|nr:MAG: hypothetical protein B6I19_07010 [Bacteroidetes bacterium 4572_114]